MRKQWQPNVVVTGASAGVGRATAIAFAQRGAKVGLIARGREGLDKTNSDVESAGGTGLVMSADVADADAIHQAADQAAREFGHIDVWVNCAMVTSFSPLTEMSPEEYRRITEVTYLGQVYGTMAALKHMRPRNHGTIVQVGSSLSYRAIPLQSAYCGAKHAIRGFTDSLRSELIHDKSKVRVSMVQLPAVNTPQFDWARNRMPRQPQPVPPIFQPETVAEAIVQAADKAPRELWVGKSSAKVILGSMVAPHWMDRFLARKAYSGQMSTAPALEDRPDNLFHPLSPALHTAHGRFDRRAKTKAPFISEKAVQRTVLMSVSGAVFGGLLLGFITGRKTAR